MTIRGGYRPAPHIAAKSNLSSALEKRVLATKRVYGDAPAYLARQTQCLACLMAARADLKRAQSRQVL
ncbi:MULTISPECIES: hypothetical protein [Mesorhizobium]|uniref:Uncharacterized protein n=1 Tax=Mesorhizobium album TaxID=3072314 RepID=A0ABU4Y1Q3_9HYPH|nr:MULTISPECIES: hypothetical protein [unclassified Mesorhizobium]MDX8449657.1 hypothetical protein [Mesorhizobium sp. VK3C]MDX8479799.1 hypothetical protein [Mesorhizobium sp. VK24D]